VKIGLIGHAKDNSSFYLKSFPTWGSVEVPSLEGINATEIRNSFLDGEKPIHEDCSEPVREWLDSFSNIGLYTFLKEERQFIREHNKIWAGSPYPPTFNTVDAVVVQSGHVLLVRRRAAPGKGLWALPGGYINVDEKLKDSMLRELREETRIRVPEPVLRGSIVSDRTFDDPHRSQRGRIITKAYYIRLSDREELPPVRGSDETDKALWVPLADVDRNQMFEDHYDIIETMVSI
jgi:bifunctional NMN adenylyltransferase/nudix hydrolase